MWDGTEGQSHVGARGDEIGGASEVVDLSHSSRFEQQSRDFVAHHRHKGVESLHTAEEAGVLQDTSHRSVGGFGARRHVGRERGGEEGENKRAAVGERWAYAERLFGKSVVKKAIPSVRLESLFDEIACFVISVRPVLCPP